MRNSAATALVAACSALKRAYRDRLRRYSGRLLFIHLEIDKETAAQRVAARKGHFMPASLVDSQFAALEPPGRDEMAVTLDARRPVEELVAEAAAALRSLGSNDTRALTSSRILSCEFAHGVIS